MRLPGDEDQGSGLPLVYMVGGAGLFVVVILGLVLAFNSPSDAPKRTAVQQNAAGNAENTAPNIAGAAGAETGAAGTGMAGGAEGVSQGQYQSPVGIDGLPVDNQERVEQLYREGRLHPGDLDFWDMYEDEENLAALQTQEEEKKKEQEEQRKKEEEQLDPSEDGRHTLVKNRDGSEEWVLISPYLMKNSYDSTKLVKKGELLGYYEGDRKTSYTGVDVSKYDGEVNFGRLKKEGIDYVMLRAGARGYGSGEIQPDERFGENIGKAAEAGLGVGLYFFSQAVTPEEAKEEAAFVLQNIGEHSVDYPIAFDMEYIENDTARIDSLTKEERTAIAKAFMDDIKAAGYTPMLYGDKEWLIKEINLSSLTGYDIWLSQEGDIPDYPYQFHMWQYTRSGEIAGVNGDANLNISFIDYSAK